jgi:surfeit locus 1 family protein
MVGSMPNANATAAVVGGARRFRPRLLPTLATIAAIALFVTAGNWQRGRMVEKETRRAQFDAATAGPPLVAAALPASRDSAAWAELRYRPVTVAGAYDAARQIYIDNRVHAGRAGYHVVTPLVLDDGRAVLVVRGWVPAGATRAEIPAAPPPAGPVVVHGRLAIPSSGYLELTRDAATDRVWPNLDPARFAAAKGVDVLPAVVEETRAPVPDDGLVRDWPTPDFGVDKHRMYMLQWYAFAVLAAVLWVVLNWRRSAPAAEVASDD